MAMVGRGWYAYRTRTRPPTRTPLLIRGPGRSWCGEAPRPHIPPPLGRRAGSGGIVCRPLEGRRHPPALPASKPPRAMGERELPLLLPPVGGSPRVLTSTVTAATASIMTAP